MNITPETLYWISRLDGIKASLFGITVVFIMIGFLCFVVSFAASESNEYKRYENTLTKIFLFSFVSWFFAGCIAVANVFVPTTKTMAAIYVIPSVVNNEKVQKIAENSLEGLVNLSNNWVKDNFAEKINK